MNFNIETLMQSGIFLGALAAVGYYLRNFFGNIIRYLKKYFLTEIQIDNRSEAYQWILNWFDINFENYRFNPVTASSSTDTNTDNDYSISLENSEKKSANVKLSPGYSFHFFKFKNKYFILNRSKESSSGNSASKKSLLEQIVIKTIGRNIDPIIDFLKEARELYYNNDNNGITLYNNDDYGSWNKFKNLKKRNINSVILKKEQKELILNDLDKFFLSKEWYDKKNVVFKRGYLLSGVPGTGKTSLIHAIASKYNLNVCMLNLQSSDMTNTILMELLSKTPEKSIVIVEDINSAFYTSTGNKDEKSGVTLSGFLNCLDGMGSPQEVLFFITTNNKQELDKALLRPGRFDYHLNMDYCDKNQIEKITEFFYADTYHSFVVKPLVEILCNLIRQGANISPARLHGYYMSCGSDIKIALDRISYFIDNLIEENMLEIKDNINSIKD